MRIRTSAWCAEKKHFLLQKIYRLIDGNLSWKNFGYLNTMYIKYYAGGEDIHMYG